MADKPNVRKITNFDKAKLKKMEMQEKNTLPTKETTEQEKQSEIS
ncbi:thymosin beta-10-like [Rhinolophus ferrumequinum]|nr:thymosin beta-10-like [Rhinolophus ferrumequinum]